MDLEFKKQPGTSGISGQLYETKLISLILLRLLHDDNVEEFYLATNLDDVRPFDDIILKLKIKGTNKPIFIFLQAKHKENDSKFLDFDLVKNFYISYMKVKQLFDSPKDQDKLFSGNFDDNECLFVLYTNAKCYNDPAEFGQSVTVVANPVTANVALNKLTRQTYHSMFAGNLNNILSTSEKSQGSQLIFNEEDIDFVSKKVLAEEISALADRFVKYLNNKAINIMNDKYMMRYHVILAQNVVNISEAYFDKEKTENGEAKKWRTMTFKPEFFETKEDIFVMLRDILYETLDKSQTKKKNAKDAKKQQTKTKTIVVKEDLVSNFLTDPTAINLSLVLNTYVSYAKGRLKFNVVRPDRDLERLELINNSLPMSTVLDAKALLAKEFLLSLSLQVPAEFGNLDLTIRTAKNNDNRLTFLADIFTNLCETSTLVDGFRIVTIDPRLRKGWLSSNGGLGGAVGNLLILDTDTKFLKFTEDSTKLKENSKELFDILNLRINNLGTYRFNIKTRMFPIVEFDFTDDASVILTKLVIYDKQSDQKGAENILKAEIELRQKSNNVSNFLVTPDTVLQNYHNEIQKWWMSPIGHYITKETDIFDQALHTIVVEPQLSAIHNAFFINNGTNINYTFNNKSVEQFRILKVSSMTIIMSIITTLSTIKVIQYFKANSEKYAVLDLKCVLNVSKEEFKTVKAEIKETSKALILVCENTPVNWTLHKVIHDLAEAMKYKKTIIITGKEFLEVVHEHFPDVDNILNDVEQSLIDLSSESQKEVKETSQVLFQGQIMGLDVFVDDISAEFIKGSVLKKFIEKETVTIDESLRNSSYDEIEGLFVERRVSQYFNATDKIDYYSDDECRHYTRMYHLRTFYSIKNDVVLITAKPGMGKSTLLTHLSLKTKERNNVWIVRINLLDYSKVFYSWPDDKNIDTLETLIFICQVIIKNHDISIQLKEENNKVYLEDCNGDEETIFVIKMFLHFYNKRKLIILFDGFDEICPHYKINVLKFFNTVINYPRKNKMWVTTRPYSDLLPDLKQVVGKPYKLDYLTNEERDDYLTKYWKDKVMFDQLTENQIKSVISFIDFMKFMLATGGYSMNYKFFRMYYPYYEFLQAHFPYAGQAILCPFVEKHVPNFAPNTADTYILELDSFFDDKVDREHFPEAPNSGRINRQVDKLMGTPLLLYLVADYFVNFIDMGIIIKKWDTGIKIHMVYEMFIETKLRKILFQDKNNMDVFKPDIRIRYEAARRECIALHKKIAVFGNLRDSLLFYLDEFKDILPFNEKDLEEIDVGIENIKRGREKTGLISHVTADDTPVFIHRTFSEYCAAEFICDILKSSEVKLAEKELLHVCLRVLNFTDINHFITEKMDIDCELHTVVKCIERRYEEIHRPVLGSQCSFESIQAMAYLLKACTSEPSNENNDNYFETFLRRLRCIHSQNSKCLSGILRLVATDPAACALMNL